MVAATALTAALLISTAWAQRVDLLPEPSMPNPKLRFQTGRAVGNRPEISPILPPLPGNPSAWSVAQWGKSEKLSADKMMQPSRNMYVWETDNKLSRVTATLHNGLWIYRLFGRDGALTSQGGTNVFLSVDAVQPNSLANTVTLSFDGRLFDAAASYSNAAASTNGAVLAQVFAGFWLHYKQPSSGKVFPVAVQMDLANSRDRRINHRGCSLRPNGPPRIVIGRSFPDELRLDFSSPNRETTSFRRNLNKYICDTIAHALSCQGKDGSSNLQWDAEAQDLRNWSVQSFYIGVETQNSDARPGSLNNEPQGHAAAGIEISNLRLTSEPTQTGSCQRLP